MSMQEIANDIMNVNESDNNIFILIDKHVLKPGEVNNSDGDIVKANVDERVKDDNDDDTTLLCLACQYGRYSVASHLLSNHKANSRFKFGHHDSLPQRVLTHLALPSSLKRDQNVDLAIVDLLGKDRPANGEINWDDVVLLGCVASTGTKLKILDRLLNWGFHRDVVSVTLSKFINFMTPRVVEDLITKGHANPNGVGTFWNEAPSPMKVAVENGSVDKAKILLEHGAKINRKDFLAHIAAGSGFVSLLRFLLDKDASLIGHHNAEGSTPLSKAIAKNHPDVVKFLLEHGAVASKSNVLQIIAHKNSTILQMLFLETAGRVKDLVDVSALSWAVRHKFVEGVEFFLTNEQIDSTFEERFLESLLDELNQEDISDEATNKMKKLLKKRIEVQGEDGKLLLQQVKIEVKEEEEEEVDENNNNNQGGTVVAIKKENIDDDALPPLQQQQNNNNNMMMMNAASLKKESGQRRERVDDAEEKDDEENIEKKNQI